MMLILLLVLASSSKAYDGCGRRQWRCGDICILTGRNSLCHCGNQTIIFGDRKDSWCCSNTTCEAVGEPSVRRLFIGAFSGANCTSGKVFNLTKPCPNQFSSTKNTTNQTREILGGKATESCNDFVDSVINIDAGLRTYTPCWKTGQEIEKCIKKSEEGDGKYHCNSRSDENPFRETTPTPQTVDATSVMTECINDAKNETGLECPGHGCLRFDDWCQSSTGSLDGPKTCELPGEGQYFFSNDKELCSHPTFWKDKITSVVTECIDSNKRTGLKCPGHGCLRFDDWCQSKTLNEPKKCELPGEGHFFSNDKKLCSHPTFWRDKPCPQYRCNGAQPGQCGATVAVRGTDIFCDDKSDSNTLAKNGVCSNGAKPCVGKIIRPLPQKCTEYTDWTQKNEYYEDFDFGSECNGTEKTEKCKNYEDWEYYADDNEEKFANFDFDSECNSGTEVCIGEDSESKCDLHPQCEDGEDETECKNEYIKKGFFRETETFYCTFPNYTFPNLNWTLFTHRAIRCDGDATCPFGEDEKDCDILAQTIKYILPLTLFVLVTISLGSSPVLKCIFHGEILEADDERFSSKNLEILTGSNRELVSTLINDEHIKESLVLLQNLDISREQRRKHNKMFIDSLAFVKGGKNAAFLWMKEHLYQETCALMLEDFDFTGSWLQSVVIWLKDIIAKLCSCFHESLVFFFKRVKLTSLIYLDFIKDTCILIAMFHLLNETSALFNVGFPSTLAWIFFASLSLPLFVSALETACSQPFAVLGQSGWEEYTKEKPSKRKLWAIRVAVVAFYFFVPAILTNNREEARARREMLMRRVRENFQKREGIQESLHKSLRSTNTYIEESTKALLIFKAHELSIEKIIQLIIQLTMVLLSPSFTKFPTNSGFQALFEQPIEEKTFSKSFNSRFVKSELTLRIDVPVEISLAIFIVSIIAGFLTTANSYMLIKKEEKKNFLPFMAKLVLIVRSLLVYAARILCIITFFGTFLGLFDILSHWYADRIPRADDFKKFTPPPYSDYTGHDIATAFGVFIFILLVQALVVLLLKKRLSVAFNEATWGAKFDHILDSINRPDFFADWDIGGGSGGEHARRRSSVLKEISVMILVNLGFNFILLYPLWVTAGNVVKVHHTRVLAFPEEEKAKDLLNYLSWGVPLAILLASLVDLALVALYQKVFHPWKRIFAAEVYVEKGPTYRRMSSTEQYQMSKESVSGQM